MSDQQKPYHHGDLRNALVRSAHSILEEEGVEKLSLRAVARKSGVSQTAPYRHFKDKSALLAAVAAEGFRALANELSSWAAPIDDPREQLNAMGKAYVSFALRRPNQFRLMFGPEAGAMRVHAEFVEAGSAAYQTISDTVARCQDGQVPEEEAAVSRRFATIAAWAFVHGLSTLMVDGLVGAGEEEGVDLELLVDRVISVVSISPDLPLQV